ncbi:MAG: 3-oxoacyl-ACP reductase FabG [Euryarchaeota archaeon]|nr:3-oxoacyl-ACP reductase FabG [Euryarchaeota archaeon]
MAGLPLQGRVAIVTASAGAGIGQATVRRLAADGADVVVSDAHRREDGTSRTAEVAADIEKATGRRAMGIVCDVTRREQVEAMVQRTVREFGRLDILVNNAGYEKNVPVVEMPDEVWERVVGVCLSGTYLCTRVALPHMVGQRWGRVVNLASIAAWLGAEYGGAHYSAAKSGVIGFTRAVAREVAPHGVTVNAVSPGFVPNPFLAKQYPPEALAKFERRAPVGRGGRPEELAAAIAFLASPEAEYITGEALCVSGGAYIR